MAKRTGPTNPVTSELITTLKIQANEQDSLLWSRIAGDIEKSTRKRRIVNLSKLNKYTKEDEMVIVPGKVLGGGLIEHKITIAAMNFSDSAIKKLEESGSKIISLKELSKESPKGKAIRIIG